MAQSAGNAVGMNYWDDILGPQQSSTGQPQYPEYVTTDVWMGQYVSEMVEQNVQSGPSSDSTAISGTDGAELGEGAAAPAAEVKSTDAKLPRWKRRTPEQIEANKLAQKRFRERKKAKQQVKQNEVAELADKMNNLERLNASTAALEDQNLALQGKLWAKEAELQRIKDELDDKTPPAAYEASRQGSCIPLKPSSVDERLDKVEKKWQQAKEQLETYLRQKCELPTEGEAKLSAKQRKELEKRSLACIALCMEALTLGGPQLEALIRTVVNKEEDLLRTAEYSKYAELAKWLNLSEEQRQQVLQLRKDVLARLERIYLDRQGLNLRIMGLLVPQGRPDVPSGPGLKESSAAERASSLREALAALQRNLVEEQRLESEHHHGIFHRILNPLQGAWFIVRAFPQHCDTLAFMHGVNSLQQ